MTLNSGNFSVQDFRFDGIYKALVEDNADPLDAGRVRVRIRGIHTENGRDIPADSLPWAEPALSLAWSGGYNVFNADHENETPDTPSADNRYNPGPSSKTPDDRTPDFINEDDSSTEQPPNQIILDDVGNSCGTGGHFVVPKRGNWVFVFFENCDHMRPIYFAMAPVKRDWDVQKELRTSEIDQKIKQLEKFREQFEPAEAVEGDDWAQAAKIDARVDRPKIGILPIDHTNGNTNRDVSCITSLNGTTIIIDNRLNREQIFVIHKNYMEYSDADGNRKVYVGKRHGDIVPNKINDPDVPTNYELGVEGNHELHVLGNYDIYAKGRIHIQCDEHVQIDAKSTVGILSREGDIDIITESGNVNLDVKKGFVNAHVGETLNMHVNGNTNLLVDGDLSATAKGNADITVNGDTKLKTANLDIKSSGSIKVDCSGDVNFVCSNFKIDGNLHTTGFIRGGRTLDIKGAIKAGSTLNVNTGISCGGYLRNRGEANIGSPVIAHGLQVVTGTGTGQSTSPAGASVAQRADDASETQQETGNEIEKNFEDSDETEE
jgi:hypothetical protein